MLVVVATGGLNAETGITVELIIGFVAGVGAKTSLADNL